MSIDRFQLDDTWRQDFATSNPASGAAQDADAPPTVEIYEDGSATPMALGLTGSKRDVGTTGQYTVSQALTAAAGFEIGKTYNVYAIAAVGGTTGKAVISTFKITTEVVYVN